jgi:hypothetical protein
VSRRASQEELIPASFGAWFAPSQCGKLVGRPWVFFLTLGWSWSLRQPIENRKIRIVLILLESALFSAGK